MGVCVTLCVCLALVLFVGWRWYFDSLSSRRVLQELAHKAEAKVRELEKLGLTVEAATTITEPLAPATVVASEQTTGHPSQDRQVPPASTIKPLPLQESDADVADALALLDKYWKTSAWKDRLPLVHDAGRVETLMRDFYETQSGADPLPGGLVGKARYQIDGTEILYFSYTSSRPTGSLEIAMLRGPDGKFLIDWESLTGYGEMSFADFRSKRPVKPVKIRAYVRSFEYFNFEFNDPGKFVCVKMTSESGENSLYAYCERSSPLGRWLEADLSTTGPTSFKGYTLQVSFPPNPQSNQCVRLDKVVTPRWLSLP